VYPVNLEFGSMIKMKAGKHGIVTDLLHQMFLAAAVIREEQSFIAS